MYRKNKPANTQIAYNESYIGETLEYKIGRMLNNKEPMKDPGVGLSYSERKDGVLPETDIRTDRWELAVEAMEKATKINKAKRDERMGEKAKKGMDAEAKNEGGTQSTDTTSK